MRRAVDGNASRAALRREKRAYGGQHAQPHRARPPGPRAVSRSSRCGGRGGPRGGGGGNHRCEVPMLEQVNALHRAFRGKHGPRNACTAAHDPPSIAMSTTSGPSTRCLPHRKRRPAPILSAAGTAIVQTSCLGRRRLFLIHQCPGWKFLALGRPHFNACRHRRPR